MPSKDWVDQVTVIDETWMDEIDYLAFDLFGLTGDGGTATATGDVTVSNAKVTATGASEARALADILGHVVNVLDYIDSSQHTAIRDRDTASQNSTTVRQGINAAFTEAEKGRLAVYFPAGTYLVDQSVFTIDEDGWEVFGDGKWASLLEADNDADIITIDASAATLRYIEFRDMGFVRENATFSNTDAIHVNGAADTAVGLRHSTFSKLSFKGVEHGIFFENAGDPAADGASMDGGHGFLQFIDLDFPLELNARYPNHCIRFDGPHGPHNQLIGGLYRFRTSGYKAGNGVSDELLGDFIATGAQFVGGPPGGATHGLEFEGPGVNDSAAFRDDVKVIACEGDNLTDALVRMQDMDDFTILGCDSQNGKTLKLEEPNWTALVYRVGGGIDVNGAGPAWHYRDQTASPSTFTIEQNFVNKGGFMGFGAPTELTISGGVVTATQTHHKIDTESDTNPDELDTINGGSEGDILLLRSENTARDVTLKDGTGNLILAGDFTLTSVSDFIMLIKIAGGDWQEISRSNNN